MQVRKNIFTNVTFDPYRNEDIALYDMLEAYYQNNGLYDSLMASEYYSNRYRENMKPLYNPANRSVEFFVSRVIPGVLPDSLPIVADNSRIVEPIQQVWKWSNLNQMKPVATRWLSIYGDLFIEVLADDEKAYFDFIQPQYITDFTENKRGILQWLRIDVQIETNRWHIETWDKEFQKVWELPYQVAELPDPQMVIPVSDYGIDFVPFVHVKFRDVGEKRGWGAFTHCLDKIDELNRMATGLHEMLFRYNKPTWLVQRNASPDEFGRDKPALDVPATFLSTSATDGHETYETVDETVISLPGQATATTLIPDIKYGDALSVLQDQLGEIEKDMPELTYHTLRDKGELSGKAVRLLLGDAISRIEEARTNLESGLIRADSMALTLGQAKGIWSALGSYDLGDFDHQFKAREVFPASEAEKMDMLKTKAETSGLAKTAGYTNLVELANDPTE